jgi:DNA helicase-2/ATP-dependent DNA helicase PcrA
MGGERLVISYRKIRVCTHSRVADIQNLAKMRMGRRPFSFTIFICSLLPEFPGTTQILLEENYRSTASILACSLAIVSQGMSHDIRTPIETHHISADVTRIDKGLRTSHPKGTLPVNRSFPTEGPEAEFIAAEVKRLIAYSGGMLTYNDFAVLRE